MTHILYYDCIEVCPPKKFYPAVSLFYECKNCMSVFKYIVFHHKISISLVLFALD